MEVQAECPWCGPVSLRPQEVSYAAEPGSDEALCEIACPVCYRVVYAKTTAEGVKIIRAAGARLMAGLIPFELLERHDGPALRWDDALDLLAGLEATPFPQAELVDGNAVPRPRTVTPDARTPQ